ncbi:PREDICTED: uncharacterized protein LOC105459449 isoform X1 [Wasmannia auropunctata]|uniref:uncharacterized protein LOC105459449 isoform X1 n=1 Tax=Wasmannia auropunctata TaxID=64793 RepID=UPI0005EFE27B|nr:PREDICTED: uncharacterized protein LOC105459449 isoform X1 [Wasmannia auropunctata]
MKPTLVADEMFPEGAGPYVELEESLMIFTMTMTWSKSSVPKKFNYTVLFVQIAIKALKQKISRRSMQIMGTESMDIVCHISCVQQKIAFYIFYNI